MLIIITAQITIIQVIITLIIHQRPKEDQEKTQASIHSLAVHLIGIVFHAYQLSTLPLLNVNHINSVIKEMENHSAIHVLNMEKHVRNAT